MPLVYEDASTLTVLMIQLFGQSLSLCRLEHLLNVEQPPVVKLDQGFVQRAS